MSLVLVAATNDVAIMKSEGRQCGRDGSILSEEFVKFSVLGDQCIVGYTGSVELINSVLNKAMDTCKLWGYTKETLTVTAFCEVCEKIFQMNVEAISNILEVPNDFRRVVNLVMMGMENGKIVIKTIGSGTGHQLVDASPADNGMLRHISFLPPESMDAVKFDVFYDRTRTLQQNMDDYIRHIATNDPSINTNIYTAILDRRRSYSMKQSTPGVKPIG